jgi:hypothetical protein
VPDRCRRGEAFGPVQVQQPSDGVAQFLRGDGLEDVGQEVEADVAERARELLAAEVGQRGDEAFGGTEQRRGVEPDPQVVQALPPRLVGGGEYAFDQGLAHARVVAVQHGVAGEVRLLGDL